MTTTAPLANARTLGLAHYAARAVLESVLARHGATFPQNVALRLAAVAEAPLEREELVAQVVRSLKMDAADARGVVGELLAKGLLTTEESLVPITDAGRAFHAEVSAESAEFSARVWGGIPEEDLAAAGRVLALVTERANAELAALSA
ncbi:MarR family transcriptional regulator [Streptomyces sp. NPDC005648]|uniref:MarR family transcriptional regulator n=1 Tax=Streptomyces sp. NPDC005648 TaxID=3157044 RepID=UPI0033BCEFA2